MVKLFISFSVQILIDQQVKMVRVEERILIYEESVFYEHVFYFRITWDYDHVSHILTH